MFDSHTHIQFPSYDSDRDEVIDRAIKAGIKMIVVGTQLESSAAAIALAEKYPRDIWATVGFHPGHVIGSLSIGSDVRSGGIGILALRRDSGNKNKYSSEPLDLARGKLRRGASLGWHHDPQEQKSKVQEVFDIAALQKLASHPKVVAIGECGLDYYRLKESNKAIKQENNIEAQKHVFEAQIELAEELNKPLMIHARASRGTDDAYEDVLEIISSLRAPSSGRGNLISILHFYAGSLAVTKKVVDAGFYFTFGGVITFAHDYDEIIKYIPLDRILLETDAPYVAPAPYRGKRNEPSYIIRTADKLAEIKGVSPEDVTAATTANTLKVFELSGTLG